LCSSGFIVNPSNTSKILKPTSLVMGEWAY
jgi:hypothetical protein